MLVPSIFCCVGYTWQRKISSNNIFKITVHTVYPKKYVRCFCFAVLCCGYTLTGLPIPIRLTSLALRQSNDCPSASKATLMNMGKFIMRSHYERLPSSNKAKHNKTLCIFLGIHFRSRSRDPRWPWHINGGNLFEYQMKQNCFVGYTYLWLCHYGATEIPELP